MSDPVKELISIQRREVSSFLDEHQNDLRPWHRKEWKERREALKEDIEECAWCGEQNPDQLHPHHLDDTPQWGREWRKAADEAFAQSENFDSSLVESLDVCGECTSMSYYSRKTTDKKYRCRRCGSEFDNPKSVEPKEVLANERFDTKPYLKEGFARAKLEWIQENLSEVRDAFESRFHRRMEEYLESDDIVVICGSCHFQEEQTSNKRCEKCGSWFQPRGKDMCWECTVEDKGLEECSECEDGWFQPSKYDACSDCR